MRHQKQKNNSSELELSPRTLFRPQAIAAQQEQALGQVLLIQPLSTRLLTWAALAVAAGLIALAAWGGYTRKARVKGFLAPTQGLIKVFPREGGIILAVAESREQVEAIVQQDPFVARGLADFRIIEFRGSQRAPSIDALLAKACDST